MEFWEGFTKVFRGMNSVMFGEFMSAMFIVAIIFLVVVFIAYKNS